MIGVLITPGQMARDADARGRPSRPAGTGQGEHGGLGRDVGRLGRRRRVAEAGGHVDDVAPARRPASPARRRRSRCTTPSRLIAADPGPVGRAHVGEAAGHADAGVVDQHVDGPARVHLVGQRLHGGPVGDVDGVRLATGGAPLLALGRASSRRRRGRCRRRARWRPARRRPGRWPAPMPLPAPVTRATAPVSSIRRSHQRRPSGRPRSFSMSKRACAARSGTSGRARASVLRPSSSRYQLAQPPVFQTVPAALRLDLGRPGRQGRRAAARPGAAPRRSIGGRASTHVGAAGPRS